MGPYPVGVVDVTFWPDRGAAASVRARDLGFDHIDCGTDVDPATLALPLGCPTAFPKPQPGWCTTPAPGPGEGRWEWTVRKFRDAPGCLLEPYAAAVVNSLETVRAMAAEVPGLRFLIDTGHVADWGEDPVALLEFADHVQLRQGRPGHTQLHVDDPTGVVDFRAVLERLDALGYRGRLSVEYFDLPDLGWPLAHPVGWATDLLAHVRALMA
ncbi:MAG: sugar phosphate isomerase/epimerase family protein [Actinomycetota bacterium]